ncbi:MAG: hypothetical protein VKQ33_13870 [Candidatus Sericytochromatia bacterium]|nr:hypothetical protein [Candidatus Sericytochromatia bacterium]
MNPKEVPQVWRAVLEPGEVLRWSGAPDPGAFAGGLGCAAGKGLVFTAFSGLWVATALGDRAPLLALFALPFLAVGLKLTTSPWTQRRRARGLTYGVTNRRVLLLQHGPPARCLAFSREEMGALEVTSRGTGRVDVYFGVAHGVNPVMPPQRSGGPLGRVGLIGVPSAAAEAVKAIATGPDPAVRGGPLRVPADEEADLVRARGSVMACRTKLEAALTTRRAAEARRLARTRGLARLVAVLVTGAIGLLVLSQSRDLATAAVATVIAGGMVFLLAWALLGEVLQATQPTLDRAGEVAELLATWERDALPKAPCRLALDLREASHAPARRWALSPHSKALKSYHRHRWGRVTWVTACGSPLLLEWVERVKYKNSQALERRLQLQGLLCPNPAVWAVEQLAPQLQAGPLTVRCHRVGNRATLSYRGTIARAADAGPALAALYAALPRRQA